MPDLPQQPAEDIARGAEAPTVTLREAAELLGITEAAVLMQVFRRSLPSQIDSNGTRRVPRDALNGLLAVELHPDVPPDVTLLTAALESLAAELDEAQARITALESKDQPPPAPATAELEVLAVEVRQARARIDALESIQQHPRPRWLRQGRSLAEGLVAAWRP